MRFAIPFLLALFVASPTFAATAVKSITSNGSSAYTVQSKDTAWSQLLRMDGASSCAVEANLASGETFTLTPRASGAVAPDAGATGAATISTSGTSTFTPGADYFSVRFDVLGDSNSIVGIVCDPSGGSTQTVDIPGITFPAADAYDDTALQTQITANADAIAAIPADDDTALQTQITANADAIAAIPADDDTALQTQITANADAIAAIPADDDTALQTQITANADAIAAIETVKVVNSFAEMNTYFRTLDLAPGSQTTVDTFVMLGPDFTMDATSTTTEEIFLPVGGGEHPRITIDLGEHIIANEADPVLAIRFGNVNGVCTVEHNGDTWTGYNNSTTDCNGVTHDFQFTLQNGMITTMTRAGAGAGDVCGTFPTAACNRTMLVLEDIDRLFGSNGGRYGGRHRLINLKLGGSADTTGGGIISPGNTWANGDECLSISAFAAELLVENSFFECFNGITMTDIDDSGPVTLDPPSIPGGRFIFNAVHSANAPAATSSNYQQLNGGFLRAEDDMTLVHFIGDVFLNSGTLGKTRGGTFDLDVRGTSPSNFDIFDSDFLGECYDETDTDPATTFLDNATLAGTDEPIQGRIDFSGMMCVQNWLYSDATGSITFNSHITGGLFDLYPAFYESDTVDTSRQGYVMRVDAGATFTGSVEFNFTFEDALTADPTTSHDGGTGVAWDAIVDPDIDAGTNLDNAYEHVTIKMGARGKRTDAGPSGADTIVVGPIY